LSGKPRAAAIALAFALLSACTVPEEPIPIAPRQLVVQAVLDLGAQSCLISLEWMDNGSRVHGQVTGANVSITTLDGRVIRATEDVFIYTPGFGNQPRDSARWNGMYRVDLQKNGVALLPGATYTLDVRMLDGTHATGTTTMPAVANAPDDRELSRFSDLRDTLRLSWKRVPGAKSYQVTVRAYPKDAPEITESFYSIFTDTSVTIAGTARSFQNDPVFPFGSRVDVTVVAVDDNYYTYFHPSVDPLAGAAPSRLTGALGLFGSVAPVVIRRYDVR